MQTTSAVILVLWRIAMFWNAKANVMPNITMPEAEQIYTVNEGDNITCKATGYPVPDIVWLNNDGSVVDASRLITDSVTTADIGDLSSVSVSMLVTRNDAGVYTCVANNSVGNDTYTITIAVQSAPIITTPETKQAYNITDGDSITCTATGYPVPDIVWLNNDDGSEVEKNRLITDSVMTTDTGNIPSVSVSMILRRSDGGIYTCLANNSVGNDTSTVDITVQHKDCCGEPDILLTADCTTNKSVQLKWISRLTSRFYFCVKYYCNADDSVDYCSATEYCYSGFQSYIYDPTTHTYYGEVPVVVPDNANCCFWVENTQYRRDPSIGCSKLLCCKNKSRSMPNITMPETEQAYIIEGDNIPCTATGYPVPDIVWLNNDGSEVDKERIKTTSAMATDVGNLYNVSVSMTVGRNDTGVYTCVANNSIGDDTHTINITVHSFPIITTPETEQAYITEGDSITCTATGYPVPDIVWLNNDGNEVEENRLKPGSIMTTDIGNIPSVSVSMILRRSDGGNYTCLANNSVGNDTNTVDITVQPMTSSLEASTLAPSSQLGPVISHTSAVVSASSIAPSPSVSRSPKLTDSSRLYIIIFICVIFIFMVLLSTILICIFSLWWKKSKRKNTELEINVKTQIEKYFDDTDDLPKDCISEVEVVIDNKDHSDGISITEDALDILAMISNKRQTSLSSIMSIINSEEHDGIADISESATTHYCNGGSAGSQSNTSSQRASCTSATPLSTDV